MRRDGLCLCGCGDRAPLATQTITARGIRKGEPLDYIRGHAHRGRVRSLTTRARISAANTGRGTGARNARWNGGKLNRYGYTYLFVGREHPLSDVNGYAAEHRLVVSERVGRPLDSSEVVHHVNGDRGDNRSENLVLLTRDAHRRMHLLLADGVSHDQALASVGGSRG